MIIIRKAKVHDWEKLVNLLKEVVNEKPPVALELEPLIHKESRWLKEFPSKDQGQFIIAEISPDNQDVNTDSNKDESNYSSDKENFKKEIIAFAYLAAPKYYQSIAYIGIIVKKEYRRKNVGSRLFYHLAEWATTKNLNYIIADIWSWNLKSIKFFKGLGFKEKSRFTDKFKDEIKEKVRMVKRI